MASNAGDEHLLSAAMRACEMLVSTVNATGGVRIQADGLAIPAGDETWTDLGQAAVAADEALGEFYNAGYGQVLEVTHYGRIGRLIKHDTTGE